MINRHVVGYTKDTHVPTKRGNSRDFYRLREQENSSITHGKKRIRFHADCLIFIVRSKKRRSWSTYPFLHVKRVPDFLRFLLPTEIL